MTYSLQSIIPFELASRLNSKRTERTVKCSTRVEVPWSKDSATIAVLTRPHFLDWAFAYCPTTGTVLFAVADGHNAPPVEAWRAVESADLLPIAQSLAQHLAVPVSPEEVAIWIEIVSPKFNGGSQAEIAMSAALSAAFGAGSAK